MRTDGTLEATDLLDHDALSHLRTPNRRVEDRIMQDINRPMGRAIKEDSIRFIRVGASKDDVLTALEWADVVCKAAREAKELIHEWAKEYIKVHGDLECGDKRYYVGPERKWKPVGDLKAADIYLAAMTKFNGDEERVLGLLRKDPFKPASVAAELGDGFFERVTTGKLKVKTWTEGMK